jgi:hypothetical protein
VDGDEIGTEPYHGNVQLVAQLAVHFLLISFAYSYFEILVLLKVQANKQLLIVRPDLSDHLGYYCNSEKSGIPACRSVVYTDIKGVNHSPAATGIYM